MTKPCGITLPGVRGLFTAALAIFQSFEMTCGQKQGAVAAGFQGLAQASETVKPDMDGTCDAFLPIFMAGETGKADIGTCDAFSLKTYEKAAENFFKTMDVDPSVFYGPFPEINSLIQIPDTEQATEDFKSALEESTLSTDKQNEMADVFSQFHFLLQEFDEFLNR